MGSWRARCGESRTPGSEGGLGKRAAGNGSTAPRSDPYPERAAGLSLWLYSAVWLWYLTTKGSAVTWKSRAWYPKKATPSFADALACLRRTLWHHRIFATCDQPRLTAETAEAVIDELARAA